ncbi:MAG: hypothetical protein Q4Q55_01890 [Methanobrevibacter sp.]|nr:hypothetical protein [Methanobrevibacter sp.]
MSQDGSSEVLSTYGVTYKDYSIDFEDSYKISSTTGGKITYYIDPCKVNGYYAYNFYFEIYQEDNDEDLHFVKNITYFYSTTDRTSRYYAYTFAKNFLLPGEYVLAAINDYDDKVMDVATLKVSGTEVITPTSAYSAYYNSGKKMTVTVKDKVTGKLLKYVKINAVFSNGKKTVTKTYSTNAKGKISFVPPVGFGTWTVTFSSGMSYIKASSVKKKVVVKKSNVAIKAYGVRGYEGLKVTLKAVVKSQGKNVKEGTVTFILNGKSYVAKVKNGVATKKIALPASKVYRYYAIFKGSNFNSPKKTYATAVSLKRYATKILARNVAAYRSTASYPCMWV